MKKKKTLLGLIAAIAIIVIGICVWYFQVKKPHDLAETKFNAAVKEVEAKNTELTSAMNDAQKILDKKEAVYDNTTKEAFILKAFIRMFFRFRILRYGIVGAIPHFLSKE